MNRFADTRALFTQLAAVPAEGSVGVLIENHDAWSHGAEVQLSAAVLARMAATLSPVTHAKISAQRTRLAKLVTRLPVRVMSVG